MPTRRQLLKGAAGAGAAALVLPEHLWWRSVAHADPVLPARFSLDPAPFTLGVASGDPTPEAVVIWTRVAPEPFVAGGGVSGLVTVDWAMATDPALSNVVASGQVVTDATRAHTVHVDVTGLNPGTTYYYGFATGGQSSVVGRTRTAPAGSTSHLRFALASCQQIFDGNSHRYAAFDRMREEDLDFVLHVGDYIYENTFGTNHPEGVRPQPVTLDQYRFRYALYRADPQLRHAHRDLPWVLTWDDHEVYNDYDSGVNPTRRRDAYQAYYEHLPIRAPAGPPDLDGFQLYRRLQFGDLLDLLVLDTRQYRDQPPGPTDNHNDPNRSMLGADQKAWVLSSLSSSTTAWRGLASAMTMADVKIVGGLPDRLEDLIPGPDGLTYYAHAWQGYTAERTDILGHLVANGIPDVVVLSGDWHRSIVSSLKVDFDDLLAPVVASEFTCTAVTSNGQGSNNDLNNLLGRLLIYPINRHMHYYECERHGYTVCDLTPEQWTTTYRTVSRSSPTSGASNLATFRVLRGTAGPDMLSGSGGNPLAP
ncbi:MAG TPA: alkaline phosphatase D family protein [Ilumatobacter sp.]|nr:alkaline phosphatase D family protein [Ilumatobacter sp.]